MHYVFYHYNPVGYAFLPHCGGKRKFSDVKAYSLYFILTYNDKPFSTKKRYLLVSVLVPTKHIGHIHFQNKIFISVRRTKNPLVIFMVL